MSVYNSASYGKEWPGIAWYGYILREKAPTRDPWGLACRIFARAGLPVLAKNLSPFLQITDSISVSKLHFLTVNTEVVDFWCLTVEGHWQCQAYISPCNTTGALPDLSSSHEERNKRGKNWIGSKSRLKGKCILVIKREMGDTVITIFSE